MKCPICQNESIKEPETEKEKTSTCIDCGFIMNFVYAGRNDMKYIEVKK